LTPRIASNSFSIPLARTVERTLLPTKYKDFRKFVPAISSLSFARAVAFPLLDLSSSGRAFPAIIREKTAVTIAFTVGCRHRDANLVQRANFVPCKLRDSIFGFRRGTVKTVANHGNSTA